ncbi:lysine N(6)-hydroxylase/L-ornithine N(5)-oxygenase family protein [Paracoccus sp. 11-3]|uniref:Lysine N(6)-hydroxylase/L-ornithine N(5)-oxygenase family protein n=1 Tax=Paracoccus amoyensis TaxID=2760093 RepID=A0A926GFZ1_9RHOB|nr:lysine N(6)-hydroxylase/L-ornithine N(5)-oxygenase family protein [Paracoccus amoyensis]MBC9247577.1 lysine N(6)-hydroxylase/L-ornithine N(5)-oxygenase family protein [Paracoccus amoyensis]
MTEATSDVFDLIGIGFGPSNLALAIALQERGHNMRAAFLEARPQFAWHPDMMIAGSDMQVSFMKDLVSLRNPRSAYSFVSYLHDKGRLSRFINRKTFFPSREEFNDYLGWVAAQLPVCHYDSRVTAIDPVGRGDHITELAVTSESSNGQSRIYRTRSLVLAPGGQPHWPEIFRPVQGTSQVIHAQDYLSATTARIKPGMRVAVIGGGQSAAEIFTDLAQRPQIAGVQLILRGRALMPSDDTPFVNEVFDPGQTEIFHAKPEADRQRMLQNLAATNYAVVDGDLIEQIYEMLYEQDVRGEDRLLLTAETQIQAVAATDQSVTLNMTGPQGAVAADFDLVILATGYRRDLDDAMLKSLTPWRKGPPDRNYRLPMADHFEPAIFVQGFSEATHGLSDTLLSVLPFRSEEIALALEAFHNRHMNAVAAE